MNDNLVVIAGFCLLGLGLAYGVAHLPPRQDDKKITYVASGVKAEAIGSRQSGDLYPSERYWLKCERKWKDNWEMRQYCENNQEDAKAWASRTVIDDDIALHCTQKWPEDWEMFKYCANNQMEAKLSVKARRR